MIVVRPVREADLDSLLDLAREAFPGMTTLPPDPDALAAKVALSVASTARTVAQPGNEVYMLVMEDTTRGVVVGTASVIACLGEDEPFYSYKLNKFTHKSRVLDKKVSVELLNLSNHFEGFAEVATLYLSPAYRRDGNGKLLARCRYLLMAAFRERFPQHVMADLRGHYEPGGRSAFWDAVGRHFFAMDFAEADLFGALHGNQFIAELMPTQPVYVNLLPADAQAVIGRVNKAGEPALQLLEREGFRWHGHVDIFDAAPSVDAVIDDLATIRASVPARLAAAPASEPAGRYLVAGGGIADFTACISALEQHGDDAVALPGETLAALPLKPGDALRYVALQR